MQMHKKVKWPLVKTCMCIRCENMHAWAWETWDMVTMVNLFFFFPAALLIRPQFSLSCLLHCAPHCASNWAICFHALFEYLWVTYESSIATWEKAQWDSSVITLSLMHRVMLSHSAGFPCLRHDKDKLSNLGCISLLYQDRIHNYTDKFCVNAP